MKIAYIMRGVPGSGKSEVAKQLAKEIGAIHSTDDFFYVNGEYRFDPGRLQENHDRNFEAFCQSLHQGIPVVICDNTNMRHLHFQRYVDAAKQAGYLVAIVVIPRPKPEVAAQRTVHNVPVAVIQRMISRWEPQ